MNRIRVPSGFCRRSGLDRSGVNTGSDGVADDIEHAHLMAGRDHPIAHRATHSPEPDKRDDPLMHGARRPPKERAPTVLRGNTEQALP